MTGVWPSSFEGEGLGVDRLRCALLAWVSGGIGVSGLCLVELTMKSGFIE